MRKVILLFAAAALAAAPLAAQTPAQAPARTTSRARATPAPAGDSARFAAIRGRYRRELDTERAALQRTRDRLREELTAAGWRPHMREGMLRTWRAGFRSRFRGRMMMRHGAMMGRRGPMIMGRGAMMRRPGSMMGGRGGPPMGRGQRPARSGNDSTRAIP